MDWILSRDSVSKGNDVFQALLLDGYEDDHAPVDLKLSSSDWPCLDALNGQEFILSSINAPIEPNLGPVLGIDEFILCMVQSASTPQYLIVLGNTARRAKLFSRVTDEADYLVVLSNLLAQISGAIGQASLYHASRDQAETLQATNFQTTNYPKPANSDRKDVLLRPTGRRHCP